MPRNPHEKETEPIEARNEEELEYERTHPGWMKGVPPAPPEVIAGQYENARPEEAGHLPGGERDPRGR